MAVMSKVEAGERAAGLAEDALARIAVEDWGTALDYLEAARAQAAAICATPERSRIVPAARESDPRYSSSLMFGLEILGCFPGEPGEDVLGNAEIADRLGSSRGATHRYITTLTHVGQLEQTVARKYRRPGIEE